MGQIDLSQVILSLIGMPGSGKTTQAEALAKITDLFLFDGGEILRNAAAGDSPLAKKIGEYQSQGLIVPPEIKNDLFVHTLDKAGVNACQKKGCILCGYPRQLEELPVFEDYMANNHLKLYTVVLIDADEHTCRNRAQRRIGQNIKDGVERNDDDVNKFEKRMDEYKKLTLPAIEHFRRLGRLITVDGTLPPEEVTANILYLISKGAFDSVT